MLRKLFLLLLMPGSLIAGAQGHSFDIRERAMYLPAPQRPGKFDHALALAQVYLPYQWLEQAISAPMIEYKANYALVHGFTVNVNVKTLLVANDIKLGATWNYSCSEHLFLGIAYQFSFEFGALKAFNYNNTIRVWEHHPMLCLGYSFTNVSFTFQGKIDWMMGTRLQLEDYATSNVTGSMLNGYSLGLFMEQRLTRSNSICFGFIGNFNKFHILGWPALIIADQQYFIPEIIIGFKL